LPKLRFFAAAAFAGALSVFATAAANAQSSPTPVPSPAMSPAAGASPAASPAASASPTPSPTPFKLFTLSGSADAGIQDVTGTNKARFINGNPSRIFDAATGPFFDANSGKQLESANDFNATPDLQNGNVQVLINGSLVSGKIEGSFGSDANVIASNGQSRGDANLTQAFLQLNPFGPLTIIAGKFSTLAGNEVIEAPGNSNYSRSYQFGEAIPFTHTGVRATWAINSKVSLNVGANNGWDDWKFVGKKKTLEYGLALTPSPGWALSLVSYNGNDFALGGNTTAVTGFTTSPPGLFTNRMLYDGVLTLHPTGALTVIGEYDNGTQLPDNGTYFPLAAHWNAVAGYLNYAFNSVWGISIRKETLNDPQGFRLGLGGLYGVPVPGGLLDAVGDTLSSGSGTRLQSNTFTINLTPTANYIFRLEYRLDAASQPVFQFLNYNLSPSGIGRTHQSSVGAEAIVKFP
jgi:hypothetical protein